MMPLRKIATLVAAAAAALALTSPVSAWAGGDWNDANINWRSYADGLAEAKKEKKPVLLIFYTDWCPHCTKYSGVFHDPKVVEASKSFVMVRVNGDQDKELSQKYAVDGAYIPRTFFLSPEGKLDEGIDAGRDSYKYFYDTGNPAGLLAGMSKAKSLQ
jgi:thiol:disulfide interchange protein